MIVQRIANSSDNRTLNELMDEARRIAKDVRSVAIIDLVPEVESSHGLYMFFEGETLVYVGKVESMSFVERIPAHYDQREEAYKNGILKNIVRNKGCSMCDALGMGLRYRIALVPVVERSMIKSLERYMIQSLNPRDNIRPKPNRDDDLNSLTIEELMKL